MPVRTPVILDVDTGIDDSLALLWAAADPAIELVAVTCSGGNATTDQVVANTLAVLELAGRTDVPVAAGPPGPLVRPLVTTPETHGPDGIGHAVLPRARRRPEAIAAADLLVESARARPGAIRLVTLGPLTNLALALRREPRLPHLLADWTFMGGAFAVPGNTTPLAEWNVHVDPDAAKEAFAAWSRAIEADPATRLPLGMGLDVTEGARILPADVARIAIAGGAGAADAAALESGPMRAVGTVAANPVLAFVVDALRFYFEFHAEYDGFYGAFIHDPYALAAALDPTLVTTRPWFVDVEAGEGLALGATIADRRGILRRPANVAVAVSGDAARFVAALTERVGGLARGMASPG